jgi:hypothetical protein
MTVIAWDGKTLASDSRTTAGTSLISDTRQKLYSVDIDYFGDVIVAIGLSGLTIDTDRYLTYINSDKFLIDPIEHDLSGIAVGQKYVYSISSDTGYLIRCDRSTKLAQGSGQEFARAALYLGKSSKVAVSVAIALDTACGGNIQEKRL